MIPLSIVAALAAVHPLHASSTVVDIVPGSRGAVSIRAFADELRAEADSARAAAYLASRFLVLDASGRRIPHVLREVRSEGDALVFDLSMPAPSGCDGIRLWNGVLTERYPDQVNLVQTRCGNRRRHLVFSAGEGSKSL